MARSAKIYKINKAQKLQKKKERVAVTHTPQNLEMRTPEERAQAVAFNHRVYAEIREDFL